MSFSLQKGKITTLIGANGCGKSTLFQLLTRNLKPDQGEICLYGENLRNMKLKKIIYPSSVLVASRIARNDNLKRKAMEESIPEFIKFNIVESEVRNVT